MVTGKLEIPVCTPNMVFEGPAPANPTATLVGTWCSWYIDVVVALFLQAICLLLLFQPLPGMPR